MLDPAILAKAHAGRGLTLAEQAALAAEVSRLQTSARFEEGIRRLAASIDHGGETVAYAVASWDALAQLLRQQDRGPRSEVPR